MNCLVLIEKGREKVCQEEVKEIVGKKVKKFDSVIEVEIKEKEKILELVLHGQSFRRLLIGLDKVKDLEDLDFSEINWDDYFFPKAKIKVEVEGVKGNDERLNIAKSVAGKVFSSVEEKLELGIDLKKPDFLLVVFFNGEEYFLGIDVCGRDLTSRDYRVFTNSASMKGDLAYYFLRESGFVSGENLLAGFLKDGTLAIEAALFISGRKVNETKAMGKIPLFKKLDFSKKDLGKKGEEGGKIYGFEESRMNWQAAKKNSQIAKVGDVLELSKMSLDESDVKFKEDFFDRVILQITKKDEEKLNEIYYQTGYVLKKKGTLMLIGRKGWEVTISSKFKLIKEQEIVRGGGELKFWLLERK